MDIKDVIVRKIDSKKLLSFLNIELEENQELEVSSFALYKDKIELTPDCCFGYLPKKHFKGKIQTVVDVACHIVKINKDKGIRSYPMNPSFYKAVAFDDLKLLSEKVKLIDFIRYNYNPRIIQNQNLLMKHINDLEI